MDARMDPISVFAIYTRALPSTQKESANHLPTTVYAEILLNYNRYDFRRKYFVTAVAATRFQKLERKLSFFPTFAEERLQDDPT